MFQFITRRPQLLLVSSALLATILICTPAHAQSLTINISGGVDLGRVSAKSGSSSTFVISPAGAVTAPTTSGSNYTRRVTAGNVSMPVVTIRCTDGTDPPKKCADKPIYVTFRGLSASGPAVAPTAFTVSSTAGVISGPSGSSTVTYKLSPLTSGVSRSFTLGMSVGVKSSATLGAGTFSFSGAVGLNTPATSPSATGTGMVYGMRPLSMTKSSALDFGRVVKPRTGNSELIVSLGNARTLSGGDAVLLGTAFTRASYTVTGESGQVISISAPPFNMTNGKGGSVAVTPILPTGVATLAGGTAGTYSFNLGGKFTMTPTTPSGAYSGSFTTTVAYN